MNDLSNAPAQSAARSSNFRFFDLFRITAELSAILSFIAFAVSVWVNSIVFSHWGQDFLQLASPTDVLMSGMRLFGYFLGPLVVALALTAIFPLLNGLSIEDGKAPKNLTEKLFVYSVYVIVALLFLFPLVIGGLWLSGNLDLRNTFYFYPGMAAVGFAALHIYGNLRDPDPWQEIHGTVAAAVIGLTGLALVAGWFGARIQDQARNGFHPNRLAAFSGKDELCAGSRVLWSGTQTTVIECGSGRPNSRILILRDGENLAFKPWAVGE
ncbi:hypothetical protein [Sphingomonas sp. G-3-2-10]|uniref:hypothetical protein n=1 Tax=Sphingomonas sp. G-3-2-10 TaxID=2728838 RepID=UPI00146CCFC2|nr:hypothetical protein [Sphingomonas sp. G-3-2-10]NML05323.1 hypothetical protein [Sphingomonas sp. G-3-2-10]